MVGVRDGHDFDARVRAGERDGFWSDDAALTHLGAQQKRRAAQLGEPVEQVQAAIFSRDRSDRCRAAFHRCVDFAGDILLRPAERQVRPRTRVRLVAAEADRADVEVDHLRALGGLFGCRRALTHARVFQHQPFDRQVATRREQQRNTAAPRVADHRNLLQTERFAQPGHFVGLVGDAIACRWSIRVAVALQIDRNYTATGRQLRRDADPAQRRAGDPVDENQRVGRTRAAPLAVGHPIALQIDELELLLTDAFLSYGSDLVSGRTNPAVDCGAHLPSLP